MRPLCKFWFYTRSFLDPQLLSCITELAREENCRAWLSIDSDNYKKGLEIYRQSEPGVFGLALLQEEQSALPPDLIPSLCAAAHPDEVIVFPQHQGGRHVKAIKSGNLTVCPQVLGAYPLKSDANSIRPCQACTLCLPV
jgi:hypothetical protein